VGLKWVLETQSLKGHAKEKDEEVVTWELNLMLGKTSSKAKETFKGNPNNSNPHLE
jgi:hypothetical protein